MPFTTEDPWADYEGPRKWKDMSRWERKEFHRENNSRVFRGLPPLNKP